MDIKNNYTELSSNIIFHPSRNDRAAFRDVSVYVYDEAINKHSTDDNNDRGQFSGRS